MQRYPLMNYRLLKMHSPDMLVQLSYQRLLTSPAYRIPKCVAFNALALLHVELLQIASSFTRLQVPKLKYTMTIL